MSTFDLSAALAIVRRDVVATTGRDLRIWDAPFPSHPGYVVTWLASGHGGGVGVIVPQDTARVAGLVHVADQVAEFLQEELALEGRSAWPECLPGHPHPAGAAEIDGAAMWVCPITDEGVAAIGSRRPALPNR